MAGFGSTLIIFSFGTAASHVTGTLTGHAPSRACRRARLLTQWHRVRWESEGTRRRLV
jgi:hypothetical protein